MNREFLESLGLDKEKIDSIMAEHGKSIGAIKTKLTEKENQNSDLQSQLAERDKQLKDLKKVDAEGLQSKIAELEKVNSEAKEEYETKLKETQLSSAVKLALVGKVHDADLVASLIDGKTIELDKDGNVAKGLEEQIKTLQESKSFLFVQDPGNQPPAFKGAKPAEGNPGGTPSASAGVNFAKAANEKGKPVEKSIWD